MARCRGCGADIIFAKCRDTGKLIPLDCKAPVFITSVTGVDKYNQTAYACERAGEAMMVSHFATCPATNRPLRVTEVVIGKKKE